MHSEAGPAGILGGRVESEPTGSFRLAGVEGGFKGMVTGQDIILERSDGRGVRIAIDAVSKVRHHLTPSVPRGFAILAIFGIIVSFRVLVDPLRTGVIAASSLVLVLWLLARRPVLVIDTDSGDRHRLTADERSLLKTRLLISRIRDGMNLSEAVVGLDDLLDDTRFPTIRPIEEEAAALAAALLDEGDGSDLESALDRLRLAGSTENGISGSNDRSVVSDVYDAEMVDPRNGLFGEMHRVRATRALVEQRGVRAGTNEADGMRQTAGPESWTEVPPDDSPAGFGSGAADFFGSSLFDEPASDGLVEQRLDTASSPSDSGDLFGFGEGAFEPSGPDDASTIDTGRRADSWAGTPAGPPNMLPVPAQRPPSSMEMIRRAQEPGPNPGESMLPPPSDFAVRQECLPGLVQAARQMPGSTAAANDSDQNDQVSEPVAAGSMMPEGSLVSYPSLQRIVANMPRTRRVRVRRDNALTTLARNVVRGVDSLTGRNRSEIDDYTAIYGDSADDGGRSTQFLWLRADQDHQASVAAGIGSLSRNRGGAVPRDPLSEMVRSVAADPEAPPSNLPATSAGPNEFVSMRPTLTGDETEGSIPGIRRLG